MSTFLRIRKSSIGLAGVEDEARPLLETEVALEAGIAAGRGVEAFRTDAGVFEFAAAMIGFPEGTDTADTGALAPLRLLPMMLVSSRLKTSRSTEACGAVNINVCPASSPTSPSFSLTCAEPSLLQKSAGGQNENRCWEEEKNTDRLPDFGEHV